MGAMSFDPSVLPDVTGLTIGVLGGTGPQGRGLAYRLAVAGHPVVIGSRSDQRAHQTAAALAALPKVAAGVRGGSNREAAGADVVIVAVPWAGHAATLTELREPLAGRIVVDCVNPLGFDARGPYPLRSEEHTSELQS